MPTPPDYKVKSYSHFAAHCSVTAKAQDKFTRHQNVERYRRLLKTATDEERRNYLDRLIVEEQHKQKNAGDSEPILRTTRQIRCRLDGPYGRLSPGISNRGGVYDECRWCGLRHFPDPRRPSQARLASADPPGALEGMVDAGDLHHDRDEHGFSPRRLLPHRHAVRRGL